MHFLHQLLLRFCVLRKALLTMSSSLCREMTNLMAQRTSPSTIAQTLLLIFRPLCSFLYSKYGSTEAPICVKKVLPRPVTVVHVERQLAEENDQIAEIDKLRKQLAAKRKTHVGCADGLADVLNGERGHFGFPVKKRRGANYRMESYAFSTIGDNATEVQDEQPHSPAPASSQTDAPTMHKSRSNMREDSL